MQPLTQTFLFWKWGKHVVYRNVAATAPYVPKIECLVQHVSVWYCGFTDHYWWQYVDCLNSSATIDKTMNWWLQDTCKYTLYRQPLTTPTHYWLCRMCVYALCDECKALLTIMITITPEMEEKSLPWDSDLGLSSPSEHCVLTIRLTHAAQKAKTSSQGHQGDRCVIQWGGRLYANLLPT